MCGVTRSLSSWLLFSALLAVVFAIGPADRARAQSPDDDAALDVSEPDFSLVNLPTTLRLPARKGDFHLTHRFGSNLLEGSFGDQANNLFGLDSGATVGLEFRYGVMPHLQAYVHRSSFDKTIQLSAKYDAIRQSDTSFVSASGIVSVESPNNFHERSNGFEVSRQVAPALGAVIGHEIGDHGAAYLTPMWVHNSAAAVGADRETFLLGVGGRARVLPTVYVVAEASPRLAGYAPGQVEYAFAVEKRAGAHVFQLNFANTIGTTFAQIARGGTPHTLYLGFNLTRKFY